MMTRRWLLLAAFLAACAPAPQEGGAEPAVQVQVPDDAWLDVGGIRLHYLDWGGQGDLMLLVPGVTATAHVWNAVAPHFTGDYRVIAMTRREHGASAKPGNAFELDTLADDIAGVIDAFGGRPAIVVGHSYAGLEMPRLARRHPSKVRALVFVDAVYEWSALGSSPALPGFPPPDSVYPSLAAAQAWWKSVLPEWPADLMDPYVKSQARELADGSVVWQLPLTGETFGRFWALIGLWSADEFRSIDVPVLSITAAQEKFMTANAAARGLLPDTIAAISRWARDFDDVVKRRGTEALLAAVPGAVTVMMDSTHHMVPFQRPGELARSILDFVRENAKR